MPSMEEIEKQLKDLDGIEKLYARKEIKELPNILWEHEKIEKIVQGFMNNHSGVLVATNSRVIFIDKRLLGGLHVEDFPYDKISSIQYSTGLVMGKITIFTSGNRAVIENVEKSKVRDFCDYVRARISAPTKPAYAQEESNQQTSKESTAKSVVKELRELAKLKEEGILTEEEFQEMKRKILSR